MYSGAYTYLQRAFTRLCLYLESCIRQWIMEMLVSWWPDLGSPQYHEDYLDGEPWTTVWLVSLPCGFAILRDGFQVEALQTAHRPHVSL